MHIFTYLGFVYDAYRSFRMLIVQNRVFHEVGKTFFYGFRKDEFFLPINFGEMSAPVDFSVSGIF